ncbi:MAG TPA: glycine oxidase ThiO [Candidatus Eisenbacteria bacterium]|nr:glycine oxidase ThiO [Candidatus Eisenbacteria bacterium]
MSRVVVIGGGVIGCAVAERLSLDGHQVTLFERDQLGSHASGAAAGELSPRSTASRAEEPALKSLALFPELIARIEKDTAINVEYRVQQGLQPAFSEEEAAALQATGEHWLDAQACRKAEPSLSIEVMGAVLLEHSHLTPPRFVRALAMAAAARGASINEGTPITGFDIKGGEVRRVITAIGSHEADWTVIAAGPWSKEVASRAGVEVDVLPQRGQLAALDPGMVSLRRSIFWSTGYLVPKADGSIIAGGTEEDSGFDDRPTVAGIATLLNLACRLVPGLGAASLTRVWAGLRPVTSDGQPIVDTVGAKNLIVATGHHRKGILLAPLAAMQVASIIGRS